MVARVISTIRMYRFIHFLLHLVDESMLDRGADFPFCIVVPPHPLWYGATPRLLAIDAADEAIPARKASLATNR